jgi:hypothetical protein
MTTVKFTALSPLTTRILRARTELQQREGKLKVGRTVATWTGEGDELDRLLDHLITQEIPGAGANSKDVRRLRELRWLLRAKLYPNAAAHVLNLEPPGEVTIQVEEPAETDRDRILDLIERLWERNCDQEAGIELTELAEKSGGPHVDYRRWLAENL